MVTRGGNRQACVGALNVTISLILGGGLTPPYTTIDFGSKKQEKEGQTSKSAESSLPIYIYTRGSETAATF